MRAVVAPIALGLLVVLFVLRAGKAGADATGPPQAARSAPASRPPGPLSPQWLNAASVDPVSCLSQLHESGARYRVLPQQTKPDKKGCGVPHGVIVTRGPSGIEYVPPLWVDCSFATQLTSVEEVIQSEAQAQLGTRIRRIDTFGAYVCVTRAGPYTTKYSTKPAISEHSFGLAVDLRSFTPVSGRTITVLKDYERGTDAPVEARGRFLYNVANRLRAETGLTHVLTPDFNAEHYNHFHIDRGLPFGWWWETGDG